jgi:hypothetical protein
MGGQSTINCAETRPETAHSTLAVRAIVSAPLWAVRSSCLFACQDLFGDSEAFAGRRSPLTAQLAPEGAHADPFLALKAYGFLGQKRCAKVRTVRVVLGMPATTPPA